MSEPTLFDKTMHEFRPPHKGFEIASKMMADGTWRVCLFRDNLEEYPTYKQQDIIIWALAFCDQLTKGGQITTLEIIAYE